MCIVYFKRVIRENCFSDGIPSAFGEAIVGPSTLMQGVKSCFVR